MASSYYRWRIKITTYYCQLKYRWGQQETTRTQFLKFTLHSDHIYPVFDTRTKLTGRLDSSQEFEPKSYSAPHSHTPLTIVEKFTADYPLIRQSEWPLSSSLVHAIFTTNRASSHGLRVISFVFQSHSRSHWRPLPQSKTSQRICKLLPPPLFLTRDATWCSVANALVKCYSIVRRWNTCPGFSALVMYIYASQCAAFSFCSTIPVTQAYLIS